jgi:hypothetical protein
MKTVNLLALRGTYQASKEQALVLGSGSRFWILAGANIASERINRLGCVSCLFT